MAPRLKVVHKYGALFRNIDVAVCEARGVKVLGVRRRANIACAEHAFALMLTLARRMGSLNGLISVDQLAALGRPYVPFDRRHTPGANWGRFSGLRTLHGNSIGIIGLGEIGREIEVDLRHVGPGEVIDKDLVRAVADGFVHQPADAVHGATAMNLTR